MSKGTTIKEAIAKFEEKEQVKASEAKHVVLIAQLPPIEKMDASLSTLVNCDWLSLSTNCIEKIANLNGLKNLKILSLGRNNIKSLTGLLLLRNEPHREKPVFGVFDQEAVGDTLEELWISYNNIEKLKGINVLKKLKVLYMSNNAVKDMGEFSKLADLPCLEDLLFVGNPLEEALQAQGYRDTVQDKLLKLKKLDGVPVIRQEQDED